MGVRDTLRKFLSRDTPVPSSPGSGYFDPAQVRVLKAQYNDLARGAPSEIPFGRQRSLNPSDINAKTFFAGWNLFQMHWLAPAAVYKVRDETVREGYEFVEKYAVKCRTCGSQFDETVDRCETADCVSDLAPPDPEELVDLERLIDRPDPEGDVTMRMVLARLAVYLKVLGNAFVHIHFDKETNRPKALDVLPAEFTERYFGTVKEAFCPRCYRPDKLIDPKLVGQDCPTRDCDGTVVLTTYKRYDVQHKVVARYYAKEVLHFRINVSGDGFHGYPPILNIQHTIRTLAWMELFQADAYAFGELPNTIIAFPGMSQRQLDEQFEQIKQQKLLRPSKQSHLVYGTGPAGGPPSVHHLIPTLADLQAKDMKQSMREDVAVWAGVALPHLGIMVPGKLGKETEALEASMNSVMALQSELAEVINVKLLPMFGVTDWEFKMKSPKRDDVLRRAQVIQAHATAAQILALTGWEVTLNDDGTELTVGEFKGQPQVAPMPRPGLGPGVLQPDGGDVALAKELPSRNLPAGEAPPGISGLEQAFARDSRELFAEELERELGLLGADPTQQEVEAAMDRAMSRARGRLSVLADDYASDVAALSFGDEGEAFAAIDRNAILAMTRRPGSFFAAITTFPTEMSLKFKDIIAAAYADPETFNLQDMVGRMRETSGGETYKLERIARTETTRIANAGRELAWRKDPDKPGQRIYKWVPARDARTDADCLLIAAQNPYTLDALKRATSAFGFGEFVPHPNCRCTVVRDTRLLLE